MSGDNRYNAPDEALVEQAERTVGELLADEARTARVYAGTGLDAVAHAHALLAAARQVGGTRGERDVAWERVKRRQEAKARLAGRAVTWLKKLRLRFESALLEHRPGAHAVDFPSWELRADRVDRTLRQVRDLRPELPRLRPVIAHDADGQALFHAGLSLADAFDAADLAAHEAEERKRELTRALGVARRELVRLFRILDRHAAIAAHRGGPVPGRSREVLNQLLGVRRSRRARKRSQRGEAAVVALPDPDTLADAGPEADEG